jgi:hypothetical protein
MNPRRAFPTLVFVVAASFALAAENTAPQSTPAASASQPPASARRATAVLKELKLTDPAKEARVRALLEAHFAAMEKWHAANDTALTPLWSEWAAQRNQPAKGEAAKVAEKIDAVYAGFRPTRDTFLASLAHEVGAAGVEIFKNNLTRSPGMDRTANAYIEMIPSFTEADKIFVRERFHLAREQAIDTTTGREVESFFKRQKDIVEAYIDEKGYDYRKSREAWIAKTNAAAEATKAAKAPSDEAKK